MTDSPPSHPARRRFLAASLLAAAARPRPLRAAAARVVIVGGGWGGLAAARQLRAAAPALEVVLIDRHAEFQSLPLSNAWLAGFPGAGLFTCDYMVAASRLGYRFVRAEVSTIDRERRRVESSAGPFAYDWLVLACGISHDYAAWFGEDKDAAEETRRRFPAAVTAGGEAAALRARLAEFNGGDLLMNIPPPPCRCPPAAYERALYIAWLIRSRRIKGRLLILDPGAGLLGFPQLFAEQWRNEILYLPHTPLRKVDPYRKVATSEFDDFEFADAILMPPQRAAGLVARSGLADGAWADQHPLRLHALADERVFVVGDAIGKVSPLFGHYPKSGHIAARLGRIAALEIAARAGGRETPPVLPEGVCHVASSIEPAELVRVEASYRLRGDGLIAQTVRQHREAQPRGEDRAWAAALHADLLGTG